MRPTICDIAKIVGVSPMAVSMALRDSHKISEETKLKIKAIAKELNYTPNIMARALVTNKTQSLGVMTISDITSPFFARIFKGIQEVVTRHDYNILFYSTSVSLEKGITAIQTLLSKNIDGLMLYPREEDVEDIKHLIEIGFPFVLLCRHMLDDQTDYVVSNQEKGIYELVRHLINLGHKNIAYIGHPLVASTPRERLNGYKKALADGGIPLKEEMIFFTERADVNVSRIISSILALHEKPTAIFSIDDEEAVKTIKILREKGIRVPEDMAVVGYDNIQFAEYFDPPLTTVDQFGDEMGQKVAQLLLDKIAGKYKGEPQHIVIEPKLVVRKSCGAELKRV